VHGIIAPSECAGDEYIMKNNIMVIDHMDHKYLGGGSICFG